MVPVILPLALVYESWMPSSVPTVPPCWTVNVYTSLELPV